MENCINIDLKCLIDLALRVVFSKPFDSLTQNGKREYTCQPQVLSEIMQRKTLHQVSFHPDFLEIHSLIEFKVFSIIAPRQTKKYFFPGRQKTKDV